MAEDEEVGAGAAGDNEPAVHQSPVATDAMRAIVGDHGMRGAQEPADAFASSTANIPVATSAPPPEAQSGVPLAEDRAAGVKPGPVVPPVGGSDLPAQSAPSGSGSERSDGAPMPGSIPDQAHGGGAPGEQAPPAGSQSGVPGNPEHAPDGFEQTGHPAF